MKNGFLLLGLLVLSAAGGGYWLGQYCAQPQTIVKISAPAAAVAAKNPASPSLPPMRLPAATATATETNLESGKLSLAEIEAKILELKKKGLVNLYGFQGQREL